MINAQSKFIQTQRIIAKNSLIPSLHNRLLKAIDDGDINGQFALIQVTVLSFRDQEKLRN